LHSDSEAATWSLNVLLNLKGRAIEIMTKVTELAINEKYVRGR